MNPGKKLNYRRMIFSPAWVLILVVLAGLISPVQTVKAAEPLNTVIEFTSITPNPAYISQQLTVSIRVSSVSRAEGVPTGYVEIRSGQSLVCYFALDAAGEGNCKLTYLTPATVPLKAFYLGDDGFVPSASGLVNLVIKNKHTPVVTITSDTPDPSIINRAITAEVSLSSDGPVPTGNVTVWRSDTTCTVPVVTSAVDFCTLGLSGGIGSCSMNMTAAGKVYLCAAYAGDTYTFPAVSPAVPHKVSESNTFTTITSMSPEPSVLDEAVWVYYTVTSPDGTPAPGDYVKVTSGSSTCTGTIVDGRCSLTFTTPHLHDVVAEYQGNMGVNLNATNPVVLQPSTSEIYIHRVNAPPTDISMSRDRVTAFSPVGAKVASLSAVDPNTDETHTFELVAGAGSDSNALFTISGNHLLVNAKILANPEYLSIRIRATDPAGLSFEKALTLRVVEEIVLPETGFAAGRVTVLLPQPKDKQYQVLDDLVLEIPRLGVKAEITGVPFNEGVWDTSWLWDKAGWLNGTAFPGWQGNSVLAAHNYLPNGKPGPFARLHKLRWGDRIVVQSFGSTYVYEVRNVAVVSPDDKAVVSHAEEAWLTLVTCKSFDEASGTYRWRVVVKAVLIDVQ